MKISTSLTIVAVALSLVLGGQNDKNQGAVKGSLKQEYIKNQGYLSKKGGFSLATPYGDSLAGFDEKSITEHMMADGVGGAKLVEMLEFHKRQYVNNKYGVSLPPAFRTFLYYKV